MVDKYRPSVSVQVDDETGVRQAEGSIEVVMNVPINLKGYSGEDLTDQDIESEAIEAIQEGKARVVEFRPTVRRSVDCECDCENCT